MPGRRSKPRLGGGGVAVAVEGRGVAGGGDGGRVPAGPDGGGGALEPPARGRPLGGRSHPLARAAFVQPTQKGGGGGSRAPKAPSTSLPRGAGCVCGGGRGGLSNGAALGVVLGTALRKHPPNVCRPWASSVRAPETCTSSPGGACLVLGPACRALRTCPLTPHCPSPGCGHGGGGGDYNWS